MSNSGNIELLQPETYPKCTSLHRTRQRIPLPSLQACRSATSYPASLSTLRDSICHCPGLSLSRQACTCQQEKRPVATLGRPPSTLSVSRNIQSISHKVRGLLLTATFSSSAATIAQPSERAPEGQIYAFLLLSHFISFTEWVL